MLSQSDQKQNLVQQLILTIHTIIDKIVPLIIKLSFPVWVIPFITIMLIWKIINLCKHIFQFVLSLNYPNVPPLLVYAILKGNGQYLRKQNQCVLAQQFYDYTSRKFMSLTQLQPENKIVEIQCDNLEGIKYLSQMVKTGKATGLYSNPKLIRKISYYQSLLQETTYKINSPPMQIDCFLLFNFKSKVNYLKQTNIDLIKLINFCKYHLNKDGYIVYGDYFQDGEVQTFSNLFEAFDLTVVDHQDITKNIDYAKKIIAKNKNTCEIKLLLSLRECFGKLLNRRPYEQGKHFIVLILQNKVEE